MKKQENPPAFFVVGINLGATVERDKRCSKPSAVQGDTLFG